MKRIYTICIFLTMLLSGGHAQLFDNRYNVWAMAVVEKGQEEPTLLLYTSPVETAENGLEYHRIVDENWIIRNESYNPIKQQYGYRTADKKIFIYDFETKKETLAFDHKVLSPVSGYIASADTEGYGAASLLLGAGRNTIEEDIDPCAGIILEKKTGDYVKKGDIIATLYTDREESIPASEEKLVSSTRFSDKKPEEKPLILERVD